MGTAGQILSSTGSRTVRVDSPTSTAFKTNTQFSGLDASTVSPNDQVVNTTTGVLNIQSEGNDAWLYAHRGASVTYPQGTFDPAPLEYRIIAFSEAARILLYRNIGAEQRAAIAVKKTPVGIGVPKGRTKAGRFFKYWALHPPKKQGLSAAVFSAHPIQMPHATT